jgi:hypothetical protein
MSAGMGGEEAGRGPPRIVPGLASTEGAGGGASALGWAWTDRAVPRNTVIERSNPTLFIESLPLP